MSEKRGFYAFIIVAGMSIILSVPGPAGAGEAWKVYESHCCKIHYIDAAHLRDFTLRIGGYRYTSQGLDENPSNVKTRVDEIIEKVQATLDMYPPDLRISIMLYPDYKSIQKIFRSFSLAKNIPLAFYSHKTKSIYVDVSSITDGVLAHEMAHAVINFYFPVPPPVKMQEILAQYVDLHIWD